MSSFGAFIRARRLALAEQGKDHSLRSVARRLGIQPAYLSRLERGGATALSEAHLDALAKILGLDADVLHLLAGKAPPRLRQAAQDDAEGLAAQLRGVGIPPPAASVFDEPMLSRFVMDRVPDMVFWVDQDGRYFYVNQTACAALGYTRQEFQELLVFDVNVGLTPEAWPELFADLRRNGRVRDHARLRRKDGRVLDVEVSSFAVDHMGGALGVGFARDITGRKALERSQRLTQATVDAVSDMIFWVAPNGRFVNANPAACAALGYTWEELMTLSCWDVNTARTSGSWPRFWDHVRMVGAGTSESLFRRKDGSRFDMELVTTYLEHDGREMLISTGRDITRRKRTEQSLRLAQFTVDNAQEGIFWVAPDGRYALVNDAGLRLLGYTREEILRLFVHDVDVQRTPGNWPASWELLKRRQTLVIETTVRRKDGRLVPVEIGLAYFTFDGQEYSASFVRDITERAAAQARLLAESAVNKAQAEIAEALIQPGATIRGLAGIVQRVARALTGSAYGYASTMDPETGENVVHTFSAMMEQGQCAVPDQGIRFGQRTDGRYPCLWGHCLNTREAFFTNDAPRHEAATGLPAGHVPLRRFLSAPAVHDGLLLGQIALANPERDYTQADLEVVQTLANLYALGVHRIRAEWQLAEARDLADAANHAKSAFLANMSHEIRTPLNGVLGMLQVLQTTVLDETQNDCVETAMQSGRSLLSLINDILDFSKIETGKVAIASEPFSPEEVVRVVAGIFQQQAQHKGLLLNAEVSPEAPALVLGDAGRLRQILFNLLGNALKFTARGSVALRAGAQPLPEDPEHVRLVFSVEDTGIGIPEDKLENIFEAFVQVDGELTRRYQGTGLGLTIVRRLVGLMGGSVHAESDVGKGTRVVFDMLARRAPALAAEARSAREARPARPARSLRVLVAEDTPVNQKALTGMLGSLGHTARVAENGARALEALEQEAFDLVLMDVRMPGLDGLETTRLIRGREDLGAMQRVPIVAVTAHALPGDRERFLAAGMNEYLPKPVRLAELAAVLERLG